MMDCLGGLGIGWPRGAGGSLAVREWIECALLDGEGGPSTMSCLRGEPTRDRSPGP